MFTFLNSITYTELNVLIIHKIKRKATISIYEASFVVISCSFYCNQSAINKVFFLNVVRKQNIIHKEHYFFSIIKHSSSGITVLK